MQELNVIDHLLSIEDREISYEIVRKSSYILVDTWNAIGKQHIENPMDPPDTILDSIIRSTIDEINQGIASMWRKLDKQDQNRGYTKPET